MTDQPIEQPPDQDRQQQPAEQPPGTGFQDIPVPAGDGRLNVVGPAGDSVRPPRVPDGRPGIDLSDRATGQHADPRVRDQTARLLDGASPGLGQLFLGQQEPFYGTPDRPVGAAERDTIRQAGVDAFQDLYRPSTGEPNPIRSDAAPAPRSDARPDSGVPNAGVDLEPLPYESRGDWCELLPRLVEAAPEVTISTNSERLQQAMAAGYEYWVHDSATEAQVWVDPKTHDLLLYVPPAEPPDPLPLALEAGQMRAAVERLERIDRASPEFQRQLTHVGDLLNAWQDELNRESVDAASASDGAPAHTADDLRALDDTKQAIQRRIVEILAEPR